MLPYSPRGPRLGRRCWRVAGGRRSWLPRLGSARTRQAGGRMAAWRDGGGSDGCVSRVQTGVAIRFVQTGVAIRFCWHINVALVKRTLHIENKKNLFGCLSCRIYLHITSQIALVDSRAHSGSEHTPHTASSLAHHQHHSHHSFFGHLRQDPIFDRRFRSTELTCK